jgi:hypothetical protein
MGAVAEERSQLWVDHHSLRHNGMSDVPRTRFIKYSTDKEKAQHTLQSTQWATAANGKLFEGDGGFDGHLACEIEFNYDGQGGDVVVLDTFHSTSATISRSLLKQTYAV